MLEFEACHRSRAHARPSQIPMTTAPAERLPEAEGNAPEGTTRKQASCREARGHIAEGAGKIPYGAESSS